MGNKDINRIYKRVYKKQRKTVKDLRGSAYDFELRNGLISFVVSMEVNDNIVQCIETDMISLETCVYSCSLNIVNKVNKEQLRSIFGELRG